MITENEKCNYRRAPAASTQTRSPKDQCAIARQEKCDRPPGKMRSGSGAGARQEIDFG